MTFTITPAFAARMGELYGAQGQVWLGALPNLLRALAQRWSLTLAPPFTDLSYNYVLPGTRADGKRVVLKVGVPNRELSTEIAALELYHGRGSVELLEADPELGALLLERLVPGTPLLAAEDDALATTTAAVVMRKLWRPLPEGHPFPTIADWGQGFHRLRQRFGGGSGPLASRLVERAEKLFAELLASAAEPLLLHGDLHHANILAATRQPWLAIDPKGLAGEPAYEPGAFLRNPLPGLLDLSHPGRVLTRRLDIFAAELGLDRSRLAGWALSQAVLSAWWTIEDHGHGWEPTIACAELLADCC